MSLHVYCSRGDFNMAFIMSQRIVLCWFEVTVIETKSSTKFLHMANVSLFQTFAVMLQT